MTVVTVSLTCNNRRQKEDESSFLFSRRPPNPPRHVRSSDGNESLEVCMFSGVERRFSSFALITGLAWLKKKSTMSAQKVI